MYSIAAYQGSSVAQSNLGWCYQTGSGVTKDTKKAAELYGHSSAQRNGIGALNFALCYRFAQGVTWDYREAVRQMRMAYAEKANGAREILHKWCGTNPDGYCVDATSDEDVDDEDEEDEDEDEDEDEEPPPIDEDDEHDMEAEPDEDTHPVVEQHGAGL